MIGGDQSFSAGDYAGRRSRTCCPCRCFLPGRRGGRDARAGGLTDPGRRHSVTELASSAARTRNLWTRCPAARLNTTGPLKGGAQTCSNRRRAACWWSARPAGDACSRCSRFLLVWSFVAAGASRARARTRLLALRHPLAV